MRITVSIMFMVFLLAIFFPSNDATAQTFQKAVRWPPFTDHVHFLFSGQSLSIGAEGIPVLSITQPHNNLTFVGGPRSQWDQLGAFMDLVEVQGINSNRGETPCSGAANYVIELAGKDAGLDMIASTVGHGGYKIRQLNKNSQWYSLLINHTQAGAKLSAALNKTYSVGAMGWLQGESDQVGGYKPRLEYKNDLIQYQMDTEKDIKAITGQERDVPLISYQLSCYVAKKGNFRNVTLAQLDASEESDKIFICSPTYPFPYHTDLVHLTNMGYLWIGHYFGKVYHEVVVEEKEWIPLSPKSIQVINNPWGENVIVEFHVPEPPLVLDTKGLPKAEDYGFVVEDELGEPGILSIDVISHTQVRIVVDRKIHKNPRLRYALDHLGPGMNLNSGASGNLRDSDDRSFSFNGKKHHLYNWCVAFDKHFYFE